MNIAIKFWHIKISIFPEIILGQVRNRLSSKTFYYYSAANQPHKWHITTSTSTTMPFTNDLNLLVCMYCICDDGGKELYRTADNSNSIRFQFQINAMTKERKKLRNKKEKEINQGRIKNFTHILTIFFPLQISLNICSFLLYILFYFIL